MVWIMPATSFLKKYFILCWNFQQNHITFNMFNVCYLIFLYIFIGCGNFIIWHVACSLDPIPCIPTDLLKQCSTDTLLPVIKDIINIFVGQWAVPDLFKVAHVRKNTGWFQIYRLFQNSHKRWYMHGSTNTSRWMDLKRKCSPLIDSNTALHVSLDQGKAVVMVLLDLSVAFDTVDHATILSRLEHDFSKKGNALEWFRSYLNNRMQYTIISDASSPGIKLMCGVPQGLVLGPQLFCLYTVPLIVIARKHGLNCHFYADDSQLYITLEPDTCSPNSTLERIEKCIEVIAAWVSNFLKLNGDKSEYLIFGCA